MYYVLIEYESPDVNVANMIGVEIIQQLQNVLSGQRSGRWYPTPGNMAYSSGTPKQFRAKNYEAAWTGAKTRDEILGGAYQASAPGEPPAVRTGRLRQSFNMSTNTDPNDPNVYITKIRSTVRYADDLQHGTQKIAPRPYINKAMELAAPQIEKYMSDFVFNYYRRGILSLGLY